MLEASTVILLSAIFLDYCLGEPRRWHPLVGFGQLAVRLERLWNNNPDHAAARGYGLAGALLLTLPLPLLLALLLNQTAPPDWLHFFIASTILYFAIAPRALEQHALRVHTSLMQNDLAAARKNCADMVSRDTAALDTTGLCRATIESTLENGSDALFAPLFWFLLAGVPGVLAYRLINTLDAMWGYKNERFLYFGWGAAKLDDLMNWIPARCCSLCYGLAGHLGHSIRCWRRQASAMASPNAGPVMASGAGALHLSLGGPASYAGQLAARPTLGCGPPPGMEDIPRAIQLLRRAILVFIVISALIEMLSGGLT